MSDLPPIGSLWRHRESGERRRVQLASDMSYHRCVGFLQPDSPHIIERLGTSWCSLADWLAWQANAHRIDKDDA
jgi:hypothetical protein